MQCSINTPVMGDLFNTTTVQSAMNALYDVVHTCRESEPNIQIGPMPEMPPHFISRAFEDISTSAKCMANGEIITFATRITDKICNVTSCFSERPQVHWYSVSDTDVLVVKLVAGLFAALIGCQIISSAKPFVARVLPRVPSLCAHTFNELKPTRRTLLSVSFLVFAGAALYAAS